MAPTPALHPPYDYLRDGADIYRESFAIIRSETRLEHLPADVAHVAVRMVHASAQPDIVDDLRYSPGVVAACREALAAGAPILCDSTMVAHGIIRSTLPADNEVICRLADPQLPELARRLGTTKAAAAIDLWAERLEGAIVAIGNAPTALFHLLETIGAGGPRPAAIVGIPVGFVGADRSKEALAANPWGLEYLTLLGRRGGSAVAAAAVNAMSIR
ncbi:precorrin-8X methylmutase [Raineyella fluvialis]|uniref:Precorrin-8X methylmutase n=1 Tax=Raineyella fluvialis TaxID=2662261 RepID=A0A5Q2FF61_9ACTN|nr:precorrin-8X methylmutase [Raineyella fluvialis]QGF22916.1 precorrin-8X methylmutase [Raineyella fluvialis]